MRLTLFSLRSWIGTPLAQDVAGYLVLVLPELTVLVLVFPCSIRLLRPSSLNQAFAVVFWFIIVTLWLKIPTLLATLGPGRLVSIWPEHARRSIAIAIMYDLHEWDWFISFHLVLIRSVQELLVLFLMAFFLLFSHPLIAPINYHWLVIMVRLVLFQFFIDTLHAIRNSIFYGDLFWALAWPLLRLFMLGPERFRVDDFGRGESFVFSCSILLMDGRETN